MKEWTRKRIRLIAFLSLIWLGFWTLRRPWKPSRTEPMLAIPRIIHQSWKTSDIPIKFKHWQSTWTDTHPTWVYKLWTDDDNLELVKTHAPWFLSTFNSLDKNINRVDAVRYLYMLVHGGFYADLDMECLKSHEPLIEHGGVILGLLGHDQEFSHNVPNAWMASVPGHPFWTFVLKRIMRMQIELEPMRGVNEYTEYLTGPVMLRQALLEYQSVGHPDAIQLLPAGVIYPFDWHQTNADITRVCGAQQPGFDVNACKSLLPLKDAYTLTYWSHTWAGNEGIDNISRP